MLMNLIVQFDNPIQPPQWGAPVLATNATMIADAEGRSVYQPQVSNSVLLAADITDELLAALQAKFAELGLTISRAQVD